MPSCLELAEQVAREFSEAVHQHIQAPAVRHAQHHFLDAFSPAAGSSRPPTESASRRLRAKTLLPTYLVQVLFKRFGGREALQNELLFRSLQCRLRLRTSSRFAANACSVELMYMYSTPTVPQ